jgi:hypothetical protein
MCVRSDHPHRVRPMWTCVWWAHRICQCLGLPVAILGPVTVHIWGSNDASPFYTVLLLCINTIILHKHSTTVCTQICTEALYNMCASWSRMSICPISLLFAFSLLLWSSNKRRSGSYFWKKNWRPHDTVRITQYDLLHSFDFSGYTAEKTKLDRLMVKFCRTCGCRFVDGNTTNGHIIATGDRGGAAA